MLQSINSNKHDDSAQQTHQTPSGGVDAYEGMRVAELVAMLPVPPSPLDDTNSDSSHSWPDRATGRSRDSVVCLRALENASLADEDWLLRTDPDAAKLMLMTARAQLKDSEKKQLSDWLLSLAPSSLDEVHLKAHKTFLANNVTSSKGAKARVVPCVVSKHTVTFSSSCVDGQLSLHDIHIDAVTVLYTGKSTVQLELRPLLGTEDGNSHVVWVEPMVFQIKGQEKGTVFKASKTAANHVNVSFKVRCHQPCQFASVWRMQADNYLSHFFVVRGCAEETQLGISLDALPCTEDLGFRVPCVLRRLRELLEKGISHERVFQEPGDPRNVRLIRKRVSANEECDLVDGCATATVIKQFFRELPTPLLQSIPLGKIIECNSPAEAQSAFNAHVSQPEADVALWLFHVLGMVLRERSANKATIKMLAVVHAANLYQPSPALDPANRMQAAQRAANFVELLLRGHTYSEEEGARVHAHSEGE